MNKQQQNIIEKALRSFPVPIQEEMTDIEIREMKAPRNGAIICVELKFRGKQLKFNAILKNKVEYTQIPFIEEEANLLRQNSSVPVLLVSQVIYPGIGNRLQDGQINFIDTCGNTYINEPNLYIFNTGKKPKTTVQKNKDRLFREAGIKLLFGLLQSPEFLRLSYREMSLAAGISLGSANTIIKELVKAGYVVETSKGAKKLIRKKELLERWSIAFHEVLKPRITIGNYKIFDKNLLRQYQSIDISKWNALWGGEPAADIYTGYLSPGKLSLFVQEDTKNWMSGLKLIPVESDAEVEVLSYFWNIDHPFFQKNPQHKNVVPPLLVYADLITSGDPRNIETAKRIFNEHLQSE